MMLVVWLSALWLMIATQGSGVLSISRDAPLVGEPFQLTLTVSLPADAIIIQWPDYADLQQQFEIISIGEVVAEDGTTGERVHRQTIDLLAWVPGVYSLPALVIIYQADGESYTLTIEADELEIPSTIDLENATLRPAKLPVDLDRKSVV